MLTRWRNVPRPLRFAMIGTTLVAFVLVATGLIALLSARPALAASSTLTVLGGTVAVRDAGSEFAVAQDGQLVGPGMTIRTGAGSHAVLTYIDGSTVTVEPETEVTIEELQVSAAGDLVAVITQAFGRTWHVVANKVGPTGRYEVRSASATASVRGTAFEVGVAPDGRVDVVTTEGVVAAAAAGGSVDVRAGQETTVPLNAVPESPRPAPEPATTVRIVLDASTTANAVAVDASGRSVGVQNGQPLRYAPGSKVEVVDGKLVMTIPTDQPGRISTTVKQNDPRAADTRPVEIQTQVLSGGNVIANTIEQRRSDDLGVAKGGVVLTTTGVLVLPDAEAQKAPPPNVARTPDAPQQSGAVRFFTQDAPRPLQIVPANVAPVASPSLVPQVPPGGPTPPSEPVATGTFLGGFQGFALPAAAPPTGIAPVAVPAGAPAFVTFTGALPPGFVPPPPPGKVGCPPFAPECVAPIVTPPAGTTPTAPVPQEIPIFLPAGIQLPTTVTNPFAARMAGTDGTPRVPGVPAIGAPTSPIAPPVTAPGTGAAALPPGCVDTRIIGVVCAQVPAVAPAIEPGRALPPGFGVPPLTPGSIPPVPAPVPAGAPPAVVPPAGAQPGTTPGEPPAPPPAAPGLIPNFPVPVPPFGAPPAPPACAAPSVIRPDGTCGPVITAPVAPVAPVAPPACRAPDVIRPDGSCGPITTFPIAPIAPVVPPACLAPSVILPDGSCGAPRTTLIPTLGTEVARSAATVTASEGTSGVVFTS